MLKRRKPLRLAILERETLYAVKVVWQGEVMAEPQKWGSFWRARQT